MTDPFNLLDQKWIPCIWHNGTADELSLREVLVQAHNLREVHDPSPLVTASLHRLLLVVLHRVFGPKNRTEWVQLWETKQFYKEPLNEYLSEWEQKQRFYLFHDRHPFYQVADEAQLGDWDNLNKMVHHVASSITATLFDHHLDIQQEGIAYTPAEAARALLAIQCFGLGYQKFTDAPCAKGTVFFMRGESLFETLMLNLVRYPDDQVMPSDEDDAPVWEMDDPISPKGRSKPKGYLDYLTWQNRRIKLGKPGSDGLIRQVAWAPGLRLGDEEHDPMQYYRKSKEKGFEAVSFNLSKALWRDSAVLLQLGNTEDQTLKALGWIGRLARQKATALAPLYRLMALGMVKNRAKVESFRAELTPLPLDYLKDENQQLLSELSNGLQIAEEIAGLLQTNFASINSAVFTLARLVVKPNTADKEIGSLPKSSEEKERITKFAKAWGVERYYWSGLELHFHRLVKDLPHNPSAAMEAWRTQLRRAATYAFEQAEAYAGQDRRTQRAVAKARAQFEKGLNNYIPIQSKGETE